MGGGSINSLSLYSYYFINFHFRLSSAKKYILALPFFLFFCIIIIWCGMFKIDLHVHTVFGGDSIIKPEELVSRCRQVGLDAVCVTEHHSYFLSNPYKKISLETGFPIFQGLEYRAHEGHLLIFGLKVEQEDLPPRLPMQWTLDWVHGRGGVAIPAHPFQKWDSNGFPGNRIHQLNNLFALEALNASLSSQENHLAAKAATHLGIHGIGGSDAHGLSVLGRAYTLFPDPIGTEEELVRALRCGGYIPCWNDEFYEADHLDHWI
jgi:predicted metal-dependent phosphoesterase TrpH